jgi:oligopeptide transport system ATP-binding protein
VNAQAPLLRIRGLTVRYPLRGTPGLGRRWLTALDGVDLDVALGRSVGIVGESGCGKSTLARAVLGLVAPHAGSVEWRGRAVHDGGAAGLRRMRGELQVVFQDPVGSLDPRMTVGECVAEALDALEGLRDRDARRDRVATSLAEVGLDPALVTRYPHELSGGQCQRAAIARAIVGRPQLVICDEAVSALDVSVQAQIVNLLDDLRRRHGLALVFISHNLAVVRHLCDEVVVLYRGRVVEQGAREAIFESPRHPYTRALLAAVPVPDPIRAASNMRWAPRQAVPATSVDGEPVSRVRENSGTAAPAPNARTSAIAADPRPGCAFRLRCPLADAVCAANSPPLEDTGGGHLAACHHWRRTHAKSA